MKTRQLRVDFENSDNITLSGRLELPSGSEPRAFALFAHCFTCSKDLIAAGRISRALTERNIGVLRFDFTGLGNSDGDFSNTTFSSNIADLAAAADYLRTHYRAPQILIGHSLGGAAAIAVSRRIKETRAVVTIAAPSSPAHLKKLLKQATPEIEERGEAEVEIDGRSFTITRQFLEDIEDSNLAPALQNRNIAWLFFHSPQDTVVPVDHARRLFESAYHPKSFISLDGADHLLKKAADAAYVGETTAAWVRRYVDEQEATGEESSEPGGVFVVEVDQSLTQRIETAAHTFHADEPRQLGGKNKGPTPYDLLLGALGSCTSMTIRLYAKRKKWPLDSVTVRLRHERIHEKDCEDCEQKNAKIDVIHKEVSLQGSLDPDQRQRLFEIADKCPVHRTLSGTLRIKSTQAQDFDQEDAASGRRDQDA